MEGKVCPHCCSTVLEALSTPPDGVSGDDKQIDHGDCGPALYQWRQTGNLLFNSASVSSLHQHKPDLETLDFHLLRLESQQFKKLLPSEINVTP